MKRLAKLVLLLAALAGGPLAHAAPDLGVKVTRAQIEAARAQPFELASLTLLGAGFASGATLFTPPSLLPQASAFFGYGNSWQNGAINNGMTLPTGAMYVPATVTNSWTTVVHFTYEDNAYPYFATGGNQTFALLGNCATAACSGGNDRYIQISNVATSATASLDNEMLIQGSLSGSGNALWKSPTSGAHTGVYLPTWNRSYCAVLSQYGDDSTTPGIMSLAVLDSTGANVSGSPVVTSTTNASAAGAGFYYSGAGTRRTQAAVADIFKFIATATNSANTWSVSTAGPMGQVAMLWGVMPNASGTPTAATVQSLCGGASDLKTAALAAGFTLRSLAKPQADGTWLMDAAGQVTNSGAALTAIGAGSTAASPILPPPCLTLNEQGPGDVFRVEPGQSGVGATGTIYIGGTWSAAACGGTISAIEMRVLSGGTPLAAWTTVATAPAVNFTASYSGVPAGGPYTYEVRPANATAYVYTAANPVYVGLVAGLMGQSQQCVMFTPGAIATTAGSNLTLSGEKISYSGLALSDSGNHVTNSAAGRAFLRQLDSVSMPGGNSTRQIIGDGAFRIAKDLYAASGWPVKIVQLCKSGQAADAFAYDFTAHSQTLSGATTGPYTGTLAMTQNISGATFVSTLVQTVRKSSLSIYANGVKVAHDDGAGAFVADNGSGATGTINYLTRAVSVSFGSTPASPVTAQWTAIQDTPAGSYGQRSPYAGYGVWGDGVDPTTGFVTQVASRMSGPFSAIGFEQASSNATELASPTGTNTSGMASWKAKWNYVFGTRFAAFSWWRTDTPIIAFGYPRDTTASVTNAAGSKQALMEYGAQGGVYRAGGSFWDIATQFVGNTGGPHEDGSAFGSNRMGRRMAAYFWRVQQGLTVTEPYISGAAFAGDYSHITITFTLPQGSSLATCGTNLSGGTTPPTGSCSITTANGTVTKGFRIGVSSGASYDATTNFYASDGLNESAAPVAYTNAEGFACTIASATTVSCVKSSGTWTTAKTWLQYMAAGPFARAGGATSYSVTAGSGYTNGTYTVAATGGTGCTTQPSARIVVSGGQITAATPATLGVGCTVAPSISLATLGGGTGGAVTPVLQTPANDNDDLGTGLYDNSGGFGGAEPGLPVTPLVVPLAVTG